MKRRVAACLSLSVAIGVCAVANAQQTVGLFQNEVSAYPGYTMFSKASTTYLIDNAGLVVHSWPKNGNNPHPGYLLDDGNLVQFNGTGFEVVDWNGSLVWSYSESGAHHDIAPMPNGNVLMIVRGSRSNAEAIAAGRDPALLDDTLGPEMVKEVASPGTVVWEWDLWNHLIQDFNAGQDNYGVVADHPELVDINVVHNTSNDWIHANAIHYNPDLDQIIVSARHFNELWVIDHSTTTGEAATSSGGNSGMGGTLLYRWGSPETYGAGTIADRQLFGLHDTQWIEPGLPGAGNMLIFNNGTASFGGPSYSTVDEIVAPEDGYSYSLTPGSAFLPAAPTWSYEATPSTDFYSSYISGAQRLPNGNTLIDQGADGTLFEVTSLGQMVWKYVNPITNSEVLDWDQVPDNQGPGKANSLFRATRYPFDHPAFSGKDLTPTAALENWPIYPNLTMQSSLGGSSASRPEGTYPYGFGQLVTLISKAESGFEFIGWTVEAGSAILADPSAEHTTFSMLGADTTVQANFAEVPGGPIPATPPWGTPLLIGLLALSATATLRRRKARTPPSQGR